jgi:hypothetical protein
MWRWFAARPSGSRSRGGTPLRPKSILTTALARRHIKQKLYIHKLSLHIRTMSSELTPRIASALHHLLTVSPTILLLTHCLAPEIPVTLFS